MWSSRPFFSVSLTHLLDWFNSPILTDLSRKNTSHRPGRGRTSASLNMPMEAGTALLQVSPLIDTSCGSRGTPGLELHLWKGKGEGTKGSWRDQGKSFQSFMKI